MTVDSFLRILVIKMSWHSHPIFYPVQNLRKLVTPEDLSYVSGLLGRGIIRGAVLEIGAGYGGLTSREVVVGAGLEYSASDAFAGPGVDFVADFESDDCPSAFPETRFDSLLVLNVLEHAFEPIKVLDNAIRLTRPGGTVVVITPSMWPVHNFPRDCQRLLPDWYVTYAERRPEVRIGESFEYLGHGSVEEFTQSGERQLPPPRGSRAKRAYSRVVHRLFNTTGRGQWTANHSAIGAVFMKNSD